MAKDKGRKNGGKHIKKIILLCFTKYTANIFHILIHANQFKNQFIQKHEFLLALNSLAIYLKR